MGKRALYPLLAIFVLFGCIEFTGKEAGAPSNANDQATITDTSRLSAATGRVTFAARNSDSIRARSSAPSQSAAANDTSVNANRKNAITTAVQKVSPAVVSITVTEVRQGGQRLTFDEYFGFFLEPYEREFSSMGSGFIISEDGLIVTNEHVVGRNATEIMISTTDGSQYEAELIGTDELADLALLRINADRPFPYVTFGNSDDVLTGEWSIAIGNPFGLFDAAQPTVTVGVISAQQRDFRPDPNEPRVYMDMIQTDAAINRGNSGGPLVNSRGEVIGVNTFIYTGGTSSGFVGLGFAIPSNRVQQIIDQLANEGEVRLSYDPGLETTPMTYRLASRYNLPVVMGLLVTSVNRNGPAYEAGVMPGDIILKIGGDRVHSEMHAQALFREYEEGEEMTLEIVRNGKPYEATMKLRRKAEEG